MKYIIYYYSILCE